MDGDRRFNDQESLASYGYQEQEIKDNEFVSVESASRSADDDTDDLYDAYTDDGEDE